MFIWVQIPTMLWSSMTMGIKTICVLWVFLFPVNHSDPRQSWVFVKYVEKGGYSFTAPCLGGSTCYPSPSKAEWMLKDSWLVDGWPLWLKVMDKEKHVFEVGSTDESNPIGPGLWAIKVTKGRLWNTEPISLSLSCQNDIQTKSSLKKKKLLPLDIPKTKPLIDTFLK